VKHRALDSVTVEVMRNALEATAAEMSIIMLRTAHSPLFSEGRDFSCAIHTAAGDALAQSHDCPIHLASIQLQLAHCVRQLGGRRELHEGDVVIANDPYLGGSHLPDITLFSPIVAGGEIVAYAANRAHHGDVGGWAPGSFAATAEEIYQEGIRIPPIKLFRSGALQKDVLAFLLSNVRAPDEMHADLHAQLASLNHADKHFKDDLIPRFGLKEIRAATGPILDYSERRMRDEISSMEDGIYSAEDFVDDDGLGNGPSRINVAVTIRGSNAYVDFSGSGREAKGPINAAYAVTVGAVYIACLAMTDPEIPANGGCYRAISVRAPLGTVVNPRPPASTALGNTFTAVRIIETVRRALSDANPARASAGNGDHLQILVGGKDTRTGQSYNFYDYPHGGWGATAKKDGEHALHSLVGNCALVPVEVFETRYPWRITEMRLREDSGGRGVHRGGFGMEKEYLLVRGEARMTLACDRTHHRPYGLCGGEGGGLAELSLLRDGVRHHLPSKISNFRVVEGDVIRLKCPGGGGWGEDGLRVDRS
jgi:N-methylhydantoinase B